MKYKSITISFFIISILCINILLINRYKYYKTQYYKEARYSESIRDNEYLKVNHLLNLKEGGCIYSTNPEIINLFSGEMIYLRDLFSNSEIKLIYRFTELSCEECINYTNLKLMKNKKILDSNNIIYLIRYSNINMAKIFCTQLNLDRNNVFLINNLDNSIDDNPEPYFFTLDWSLRAYDFLIPDRYFPQYIDVYLDTLTKKYFN